MTKITEQDVVTFLTERVASIQAELIKTETALAAFKGTLVPAINGSNGASSFKANAVSETPSLKKRGRKPSPVTAAYVDAPNEYDPKLKFDKKIAYALAKAGPSFKEDVFKLLNDLEPEADPKKLDKDVTVKLSVMFKKGQIKAEKEGRKSRYSL